MTRKRNGNVEVSELYTYIKSDGQLYRSQGLSIIKNLAAKKGSGKYNSTLAAKLYGYLAENGAKKYTNEYARGTKWNEMFSVADRKAVAQRLRDDFEDEWNAGSYREYVPKKYQGKVNAKANPQVGDYELTLVRKVNTGSAVVSRFKWKANGAPFKFKGTGIPTSSGEFELDWNGKVYWGNTNVPPAVLTAAKRILKGQA